MNASDRRGRRFEDIRFSKHNSFIVLDFFKSLRVNNLTPQRDTDKTVVLAVVVVCLFACFLSLGI